MSRFDIKTNSINAILSDNERLASRLWDYAREINDIRRNLRLNSSSSAQIRTKLSSYAEAVSKERNIFVNYNNVGKNVKVKYSNVESKILNRRGFDNSSYGSRPRSSNYGQQSNYKKTTNGTNNSANSISDQIWDFFKGLLKEEISSPGIIGTALGAGAAWYDFFGEKNLKNAVSAAKDTWELGCDAVDFVGKAKQVTRGLAGITWKDVALDLVDGTQKFKDIAHNGNLSAWQKFASAGGKTFLDEVESVGKAKKIGSIALSAVTNAIDNYDEYSGRNDISQGYALYRGTAETAMETIVDWGKYAAVSAGVAGLAAAAGIAAPAVAVGAATVGIIYAADVACKWATRSMGYEEKGVTELVSDFALDVGEKAVKGVTKGASALWSGLKNGLSNTSVNVGSSVQYAYI